MKIGIDIRDAQGMRAGKGVYVYELLKALSRIDHENDFVLYARSEDDFSFLDPAFRMRIRVVKAPSILWHVVVALRMWLIDRVDVFIAPTSYIIPFLLPQKCVVVVHDVYALIAPDKHLKKAVFIESHTFKRAVSH